MLIFVKNVKKFLNTEGTSIRAIHYRAGRAYATNWHSSIWVEEASGREGVFDAESNVMVEGAVLPDYDKLFPPPREDAPYATVGICELVEFLAVLKAVSACTPKKQIVCLMLVWRPDGLRVYARDNNLHVEYRLSGKTENFTEGQSMYSAFNGRRLSDLVDYFRQRKAPVRFYSPGRKHSPLRMDVDTDMISATPAGGFLAPLHWPEDDGRFADIIPDKAE